MRDPDLGNWAWQKFRAVFIATAPPICALCGQPVDKRLPGTHRDGPTVDHRIPRSRGGRIFDRANCQLAHLRCNSQRRNDDLPTRTSRKW